MSFVLNESQCYNLNFKNNYSSKFKARIIPYLIQNGILYYLLCEEKYKSKNISNQYNILGGHCETNETIIECAKRELEEETLNTIKLTDYSQILKRNKRYIIFIPINKCPINEFKKRKQDLQNGKSLGYLQTFLPGITEDNRQHYDEIISLKWIPSYQMNRYTIYQSVKDVFQNIKLYNNTELSLEDFENNLKILYCHFFPQFNNFSWRYTIQQSIPFRFESYFSSTSQSNYT